MGNLYSVAISPPELIMDEVKSLKLRLKEAVNRHYSSVNSLAHITFCLFQGNESTFNRWEEYLQLFCTHMDSFPCRLDRTGSFWNGAFFLAPDEASRTQLIHIMKGFHKSAPRFAFGKSTQPHMSIGRQLSAEEVAIARTIIPSVDLSFLCDNLVIRKFNEAIGQYDLYKRYYFRDDTASNAGAINAE
jgi:2'-5' RNA ligase